MTIVTRDLTSVSETVPIDLRFHVIATLNVDAVTARRQVNRQVVVELGTGLIAQVPELVIGDTNIVWRVPIVLSLPDLGDLGQVGTVDVDAETGEILMTPTAQERIIQHARRLYTGATLQAE
jgi:hypothetical protein